MSTGEDHKAFLFYINIKSVKSKKRFPNVEGDLNLLQ